MILNHVDVEGIFSCTQGMAPYILCIWLNVCTRQYQIASNATLNQGAGIHDYYFFILFKHWKMDTTRRYHLHVSLPYQPEWCRSKLILSLWFVMRVTVYITVLFICSVCSDGSWCWGGACIARVTSDGQTRLSLTSHPRGIHQSNRMWHHERTS